MSKQGAKTGNRLTKEQKGEIIRMLYAGVPKHVILEKCEISERTYYRISKECKDLPAVKKLSGSKKAQARARDDKQVAEEVADTDTAISRDELASYALQGMRENLARLLANTTTELEDLDGTERIYAEVAVRKEVRMTLTQLGKWGGLENFVEHDNPVLADFARAMDSKKDDEDPEGWEVTE